MFAARQARSLHLCPHSQGEKRAGPGIGCHAPDAGGECARVHARVRARERAKERARWRELVRVRVRVFTISYVCVYAHGTTMTPVGFLCRSLGIHGALTVTGRKRSTPAVPVFVLIYVMVVD